MSARASTVGSLALLALLAVVAVHNAFSYPSIGGYDAQEYVTYADEVANRGSLPDGSRIYHTPPGFPVVAGLATRIGRELDLEDPAHFGQLVSALAIVATGVIVLLLGRNLWPGRPTLWLAAVGFFVFLPTVVKTGAMFHPEPLGMLVTAAALLVLTRVVRSRRFTWTSAVALGLLLGIGQLVRGWALWMVAVALFVLIAAVFFDPDVRSDMIRVLAVSTALAVVIPAPWYVHQATRYANPVFNRPQPDEFLLARRPLAFYVDGRFPDVVRRPWAGHFNDRFWPVFYAETWGDYFGIWSWGPGRGDRTDAIDAALRRQSVLGILPSTLALAGIVALVGLAFRHPREDLGRLVAVLPPLAATASILFLAVAYPSSDGDTIKGTYALGAAPAVALCFGFAVDRLAQTRLFGIALALVLGASALAMLPFLVW